MEVGDLVWAHDPQSGEAGARAVTAIWPHEDTLVEFEVGNATITTTEDHEFWNVTDQAWQETQHIDPGDNLLTADGHVVEAGNLLWDTAHHAPAFDPTVDDIHTYHVTAGAEEVLVHNACDIENANFAQSTFSENFSDGGLFAGLRIDDVAESLRTGALNPSDVPIDVIVRDGNTLILDTRSAQALTRADVPRRDWSVTDRTGNPEFEARLQNQLDRNELDNSGTSQPVSEGN